MNSFRIFIQSKQKKALSWQNCCYRAILTKVKQTHTHTKRRKTWESEKKLERPIWQRNGILVLAVVFRPSTLTTMPAAIESKNGKGESMLKRTSRKQREREREREKTKKVNEWKKYQGSMLSVNVTLSSFFSHGDFVDWKKKCCFVKTKESVKSTSEKKKKKFRPVNRSENLNAQAIVCTCLTFDRS